MFIIIIIIIITKKRNKRENTMYTKKEKKEKSPLSPPLIRIPLTKPNLRHISIHIRTPHIPALPTRARRQNARHPVRVRPAAAHAAIIALGASIQDAPGQPHLLPFPLPVRPLLGAHVLALVLTQDQTLPRARFGRPGLGRGDGVLGAPQPVLEVLLQVDLHRRRAGGGGWRGQRDGGADERGVAA